MKKYSNLIIIIAMSLAILAAFLLILKFAFDIQILETIAIIIDWISIIVLTITAIINLD